jgi:hypothetical protein
VAISKGWTFNGISPVLGAYKLVNTTEILGATGVIAEMGTPPEDYTFTGVDDLDTYKDSQTFAGITGKYGGYSVTQVGSQFGLTGIAGFTNNNIKNGL